jgi:hypothetical protein
MRSQREDDQAYQSYLLRLCRTHSAGDPAWRASLENPLTAEVLRFAGLPGLFAFLLAQTGQVGPRDRPDGTAPLEFRP